MEKDEELIRPKLKLNYIGHIWIWREYSTVSLINHNCYNTYTIVE